MPLKSWRIVDSDTALQNKLAEECGITNIVAQLLINRNIREPDEVETFLRADLRSLHNPLLLKDMEKAVRRIKKAISGGEKVMIYGDYDVDGITGVALLKRAIRDIGGNEISYIPDRIEEGYGLNKRAARAAHRQGVSVLITVDCGITAKDEVNYLNSVGITTIVTDHHKIIKGSFPDAAYAVINPLQKDCRYPFKYLSGVAVAYKLAEALTAGTGYDIREHLDLVALGTVQDMVPQLGENRILTKHGLMNLNNSGKKGINALIQVCGLKNRTISTRQIGYMLGPRINAAGRVSSAKPALNLLITDDEKEAAELAEILERENRNRQKIGNSMMCEAVDRVESEVNFKEDRVIVLEGDNWHPGVIGIVASRIAERFHRPTIMISFDKDEGKGSGRSIDNFHLFEALTECRDFLTDFGGHAAACGLKIMRGNLDGFRFRLNRVASELLVTEDLVPNITIDMEIPLWSLKHRLISELDTLSPFGPGNPRPVLSSKSVRLKSRPRFLRREGIKMLVTDGNITCEAVGFGIRDMVSDILESATIDIAYTPSIDRWRGVDVLQLELMDVRANLV